MMNSTRTSLGTRLSGAAGDALDATTQALDTGKPVAAETAGKISETARDLRDGAADLVRQGAESVSNAAGAAQRQLGEVASTTRRYVANDPLKSALISAGVGAVAALLLMVMLRHRSGDQ